MSKPGPGSEEASLVEHVDQTEQPTQGEQQQQLQSQSAEDQTPAGIQTPERQGEHQPLTAGPVRLSQEKHSRLKKLVAIPNPTNVKLLYFRIWKLHALAGGLGRMSLVNDYQTFRPNLGSSSVVMKYKAW